MGDVGENPKAAEPVFPNFSELPPETRAKLDAIWQHMVSSKDSLATARYARTREEAAWEEARIRRLGAAYALEDSARDVGVSEKKSLGAK